ncbi:ATP-binding protein [Candidatus Poribacteria bacterium]
MDEQEPPLWDYEDFEGSGWKSAKDSSDLQENPQKHQIVWLLTRLPEGRWQQPTLFISGVSQSFETYLENRLIQRSGKFVPSAHNKYSTAQWQNIPLESIPSSRMLLLKVYSADAQPAKILGGSMWLGEQAGITRKIIKTGAEHFILGLLFVFIGLLSFFIYIRRKSQKLHFVISFGLFVTSVGMAYVAESSITQLFVESPIVRYYFVMAGFLSFPIGLYMFVEHIDEDKNMPVRRLWQLHILVAVLFLLLDITDIAPMSDIGFIFGILLLFGISIGVYRLAKDGTTHGVGSKAFTIGAIALSSTGLHDTLIPFGIIPPWHFIFIWGVFIFILCLAYVLEQHFAQAQRDLEAYSKELEVKSRELEVSNEKLEEYSQTLEERVEERTQQLRETQDQLIMQEKMASLGNLVAGVAHEMNNPVGAIHSSADVANRGIRKLKTLLKFNQAEGDQVERSLRLLEANHEVITTGSERIAEIIQSLRSFSRLDEAIFQEMDIHECIDTTLTLLQHELRDRVAVTKDYGELPRINGYPNELNQMFMNLLSNAIQAIEDQGTIRISTFVDENEIIIKISDTGKGISPDDLSRIFDPGFTGVGVGKGLGLSIVYNIIQKHQGDVHIDSEVGKGTEVTLTLPVE